jgi:hypothetical protein
MENFCLGYRGSTVEGPVIDLPGCRRSTLLVAAHLLRRRAPMIDFEE